jgi:hypothetical protein
MPKAKMDGTQMPIKMAAFASPLKYKVSEKMSERKADKKRSLSVNVNFLNIFSHFYSESARCATAPI